MARFKAFVLQFIATMFFGVEFVHLFKDVVLGRSPCTSVVTLDLADKELIVSHFFSAAIVKLPL